MRSCAAVEELDGQKFQEDAWTRPGGGGGISRVLQDGNVFEKAGVNVSVVYGQMPPEAYRAATGEQGAGKEMIPFFAAGISSVMHPQEPHGAHRPLQLPVLRDGRARGRRGAPRAWWFGGGTDLTPSYIFTTTPRTSTAPSRTSCDKHDEDVLPPLQGVGG